jgi:NAD/NADP transhydrogenase beta subunit
MEMVPFQFLISVMLFLMALIALCNVREKRTNALYALGFFLASLITLLNTNLELPLHEVPAWVWIGFSLVYMIEIILLIAFLLDLRKPSNTPSRNGGET